jgi:hypothetical protein
LLEGIELGLTLKFGDEGMQIMPSIRSIHNLTHLETIKDAIKNAQDISELKTIVDKLSSMN